MFIVSPPKIVTSVFHNLVWKFPANQRSVYLTFDDGPVPEVTPRVLDILDAFNAKATFFCVANNVRKHPELFQRLKAEGHSVGNHTYHHMNGWKNSSVDYVRDVLQADKIINSNLFRPPHGKIRFSTKEFLQKRFDIIMWDVLSRDYNQQVSGDEVVANVMDNVTPGSVVVFHDSIKAKKNVLYALPRVLEQLAALRYTFKAIGTEDLLEFQLAKTKSASSIVLRA